MASESGNNWQHQARYPAFPASRAAFGVGRIIRTTLLAFRRRHGLRVRVQRDSAVRVPQQLLNYADVLAVRLQYRRKSVTKRLPADVLRNSRSLCCRVL
jgi:hypothetical protein